MEPVTFYPVGVVHSPHKALAGMPVQPPSAAEFTGEIEIFPEYAEGLLDIEGFSRLMAQTSPVKQSKEKTILHW